MLVLDPLGDEPSLYDVGAKVVVRTDKDGKHPYLYAYAPMRIAKMTDGREHYFSYGQEVDPDVVKSVYDLERYVYNIKDLKHFKSAVRLRNMSMVSFIEACGFVHVGYDPDTMEDWYRCMADQGRLTD